MMIRVVVFSCLLFYSSLYANTVEMLTDYGTSAKTQALGGIEGLDADAYTLYENPARMSALQTGRSSLFYSSLIDDESHYASFAHVFLWKKIAIGLGYTQLAAPNIDHTAEDLGSGQVISVDTFSTKDNLYKLGFARAISEKLSVGASLHYYTQSLYTNKSSGSNMDIGVVYDHKSWKNSLAIKNILSSSQVSYTNTDTTVPFPRLYVLSTQYQYFNFLKINGQLKYDEDSKKLLRALGIDYAIMSHVHCYAGYSELYEVEELKSRFTVGMGMNLQRINLQYSYSFTEFDSKSGLFAFSISI